MKFHKGKTMRDIKLPLSQIKDDVDSMLASFALKQ